MFKGLFFSPPTVELCVNAVCVCVSVWGVLWHGLCKPVLSSSRHIWGSLFLGHQIIRTHFPLEAPLTPFSLHSLTHTLAQEHTHTHIHNHILQESLSGSYWGLWRVSRSDWVLPGEGWGKTWSHAGETRRREHFTTNTSGWTFKTAEMEPSQQQVSMFLGSQAGRLAFSSQACGRCWLILSVISQ